MTDAVERRCAASACPDRLPTKHLRVQFAPPDSPWREARFHDLLCLMDYLEEELGLEDAVQRTPRIFTDEQWVRRTDDGAPHARESRQ